MGRPRRLSSPKSFTPPFFTPRLSVKRFQASRWLPDKLREKLTSPRWQAWRRRLGISLFLLSFIPAGMVLVVPFLDLPLSSKAIAITVLFIINESLAILGVALLGKEIVQRAKLAIKAALKSLLKR